MYFAIIFHVQHYININQQEHALPLFFRPLQEMKSKNGLENIGNSQR